MATKIRLQRHGRSKRPFYYIVVASSRTKRDGQFIDKIGTYNPLTVPATIELNFEKACQWILTGAEPTDTCKRILSYKGVLYYKHLMRGLRKGALTQEQVDAKVKEWIEQKENSIKNREDNLSKDKAAKAKEKAEFEAQKRKKYEEMLSAKLAGDSGESSEADVVSEAPSEEAQTETTEASEAPVE
ncbi:MAG: 30S ribosomal protein S16 [Chitinophagales bacterium]|jgi:small subunit ribosomal protein S16|nr:30S ribosomal protein S16 [Chitinophagales bacterium]